MGRFLLKRLASMLVVLVVLIAAMFLLQHLSPTNPVDAMFGRGASPQITRYWTDKLGYNQSTWDQFWHYFGNVVHGNFGYSLRTRQPIASAIDQYLPATVELTLVAFGFALVGGLLMALLTVRFRRAGSVVRWAMIAGASAPAFLLAVLGLLLFYQHLGWLPASGQTSVANAPTGPTGMLLVDSLVHGQFATFADAWRHILLPAVCLALVPSVAIGRVLASALTHTMASDHIRTARMNGLPEWKVVAKHGLRNSLNGSLSMAGLQFGAIFVGIVVIEQVFAWPGLGSYTAQSIAADDFPVVLGITLVIGALYVVVNAVVDVLQVLADRRIALS